MAYHSLFKPTLPILLFATLLAACAPQSPRPEAPAATPAVANPALPPPGPELSRADGPDMTPPPVSTATSVAPKAAANAPSAPPAAVPTSASPPAVLALLQEADGDTATGNLDAAAASLERAIRIQPRSAVLWQKLAEVRLRQQQPGLAEDLAQKSIVLGRGDAALTKQSWAIIADARRKQGDAEGAADAEAKAGP